jgi:2-oxoglutarate ferredoxin oxidoreductase subunit gamma
VAKDGLILLNSSLIDTDPTRKDVEVLKVPTVELAREVGSERAINMVMMGAYCATTKLLSFEQACKGMEESLKGKDQFFPLNRKGIERGFSFVVNGK